MYNAGKAQALTGSHICDVGFARESDYQVLFRDLAEVRIVVSRNSILTDNARKRHVFLYNGHDLSVTKFVASDLCLRDRLTIRRRHLNYRPYACLVEDRMCKLTIRGAAKLRCTLFRILIPDGVEINGPTRSGVIHDRRSTVTNLEKSV